MPELTLYFLQASRAIRIAWLLHVLKLDYKLEFFDREKEKAPPRLKDVSGNPLGKSPTLKDGELTITESGAIAEYLCRNYDKEGKLTGGKDEAKRIKVGEWTHAAEGTFAIHALALLYARWAVPSEALSPTEKFLSANILKDLDWLESELGKSKSGWLVDDDLTLADIMVEFCAEFVFERKLGLRSEEGKKDAEGDRWKHVRAWMKKCEESASYKAAVKKTGYTLRPETGVNWKMHL